MFFGINSKTMRKKANGFAKARYRSSLMTVLEVGPSVALLIVGTSLAVAHHFLYAYLNEKNITPSSSQLPPLMKNQRNVNLIGTAIAHGVRITLSVAISATFTQMFWDALRLRARTIKQIDALLHCRQSAFSLSAPIAAKASFTLYITSLLSSATALVVVFAPGSLTISTNSERIANCLVPSVPPFGGDSVDAFTEDFQYNHWNTEMTTVLSLNSYFPPFRANRSFACGDVASCSYNVSFVGPALDCVDITERIDFSVSLIPQSVSQIPYPVIWAFFLSEYSPWPMMQFVIRSQDLATGKLQATNCTGYSATYNVNVTLEENSATVDILNLTLGSELMISGGDPGSFISLYAQSGMELLDGIICGGPNGITTSPDPDSSALQTSPFFVTTPSGNHTFSDTPAQFASTFFNNISISMLSGSINFGPSKSSPNQFANGLHFIESTCSSVATIYTYRPARLLSAYCVALGVAIVVVVYGCRLIIQNGTGTIPIISDIIQMAMTEEFFAISRNIHGRTRILVDRDRDASRSFGILRPVVSVDDTPGVLQCPSKQNTNHGCSATNPKIWRFLAALNRWLSWPFIAIACCMTLNHAFYRYLDGRVPSSSFRGEGITGWIVNQAVVSDIGVALSYAGQVLTGTTIASTCTQLFWYTARSRGWSVFQLDAFMTIQVNPISPSFLRALRASLSIPLLTILMVSTPLVSLLAPGLIQNSEDYNKMEGCNALQPRNLSALAISKSGDYSATMLKIMSSGTYLPPSASCGPGPPGLDWRYCSYDLQFIGPSLKCEDVTASSDFTAFKNSQGFWDGSPTYSLFSGQIIPTSDLTMQVNVQTWDVTRPDSAYQAVNCTGVLQSYSVTVSHSSTLSQSKVTESRVIEPLHADASHLANFAENFLFYVMDHITAASPSMYDGPEVDMSDDEESGARFVSLSAYTPSTRKALGSLQLNGNISWSDNMTLALEGFAQNATLSLLSGQIFAFDPSLLEDNANVLENITTTCTYTYTAYKYTPCTLFLMYGVALFVAFLCAMLGSFVIRRNGVEESMRFSRILRAVLNERMFNARENINQNTIIKADETPEGSLAPSKL